MTAVAAWLIAFCRLPGAAAIGNSWWFSCGFSKTALIAVFALLGAPAAMSQEGVPAGILERTVPIYPNSKPPIGGTGFFVDYKGAIYLITARHMVKKLPTCNAEVHVWLHGEWKTLIAPEILYPHSIADIAVLETGLKLANPWKIAMNAKGILFGQRVWFLGYPIWSRKYPHGISSPFKKGIQLVPFIKRATLSAIDGSNPGSIVMYLDGFNNHGFSGGPVVFWDYHQKIYKIAGVVSGYKTSKSAQKTKINGQTVNSTVLQNSGIVVTYGIQNAIDAIRAGEKSSQCSKR